MTAEQYAKSLAERKGKMGPMSGPERKTCKRGHVMTPKNTRMHLRKGTMTKICMACEKDRMREFDLAQMRENVRELTRALREDGATIQSSMRAGLITNYKWLALKTQQPQLAKRLGKISHENAKKVWVDSRNKARLVVACPAIGHRRYSDDEIVRAAKEAVDSVARYMPEQDRNEIMSLMVIACLEGKLEPSQMAKQWIEYRKKNSTINNPRFNPLAHRDQRHLPVLSMEGTMLYSQDSDGVALGTTLSNGFWQTGLNPEEALMRKEEA